MSKGPNFERETCKQLSDWWIAGRDDIFWRSDGSGGRATSRHKRGKATFGQVGDVRVSDPIGAPLLKAFTIELKRGYPKNTIQGLVDRYDASALGGYEKWIVKARNEAKLAGSRWWMVVTKRNHCNAIAMFPYSFVKALFDIGNVKLDMYCSMLQTVIRTETTQIPMRIGMIVWGDWLKIVSPVDILNLFRRCDNEG